MLGKKEPTLDGLEMIRQRHYNKQQQNNQAEDEYSEQDEQEEDTKKLLSMSSQQQQQPLDPNSTNDDEVTRSLDTFLEQASECWKRKRRRNSGSTNEDVVLNERVAINRPNNNDDEEDIEESSWNLALVAWRQRRYWLLFLSLGVANSSDAAEVLCINYLLAEQSVKDTFLQHHWHGGLLAGAVFAGMLLGGLLVGGSWGDVLGRRPTLLWGLVVNGIAGVLSCLAWDIYSLSILRFVAGVGIGTTVPPLFTLCSELAPPKRRGLCVTLAASFWMVGSIYVAVTAWGMLGLLPESPNRWRWFAVVCALPSASGWWLVWKQVPESPRFLLMQGNYGKAVMIANELAERLTFAGNPWMILEATDQHSDLAEQQQQSMVNPDGSTKSGWEEFIESISLLYLPEVRPTTTPLQLLWFSLSFGTYGLYTWINTLFEAVHLKNVYFNALLFALSNLPGNILSALLMDRIGREKLLVASVLASAASLLVFAFFAHMDPDQPPTVLAATAIVLSTCVFQMFTIMAWNSIDVLTSELFPTSVRAMGMGVCAASGRVGALLAQFVNGALVAQPVLLLLVAAITLLLGAMTPLFLPTDRSGQPVRDSIRVTSASPELTVESDPQSKYNIAPSGSSQASLQHLM